MSDGLPDPLVPIHVDLRGYDFMPFYGERCFKSETWVGASAEARCAMVRLWWHAYANELPAASLPDNDLLLADYSGYGVAIKAWRKVKPQAMRGFLLCNDSRWYHEILASIAIEAWEARQSHKHRTLKGRISQAQSRVEKAKSPEEKAHAEYLLQNLQQELSQAFSVSVTDLSNRPGNRPVRERTVIGQGQGYLNSKAKGEVGQEPPDPFAHPPKKLNGHTVEAREILLFLNEKTGRAYEPVDANLRLICSRLAEGATVAQMRQVIAKKCREWQGNEKMEEFLRPKTLFGATNYANYAGELVTPNDA